jgi:hypothetical protein
VATGLSLDVVSWGVPCVRLLRGSVFDWQTDLPMQIACPVADLRRGAAVGSVASACRGLVTQAVVDSRPFGLSGGTGDEGALMVAPCVGLVSVCRNTDALFLHTGSI